MRLFVVTVAVITVGLVGTAVAAAMAAFDESLFWE